MINFDARSVIYARYEVYYYNNGNAIYTTGGVSIVYTLGGVYKRLYTPPALVRRTHLGWSRKQLEYVGMG